MAGESLSGREERKRLALELSAWAKERKMHKTRLRDEYTLRLCGEGQFPPVFVLQVKLLESPPLLNARIYVDNLGFNSDTVFFGFDGCYPDNTVSVCLSNILSIGCPNTPDAVARKAAEKALLTLHRICRGHDEGGYGAEAFIDDVCKLIGD